MARRSLSDRNIRKLSRVGGGKSYSVTIPLEMVCALGWKKPRKLSLSSMRKRENLLSKIGRNKNIPLPGVDK